MFNIDQFIVLYARLSRKTQDNRESVGIQLAEGRAYVEENGGQVSRELKDDGISASDTSKKPRPDYINLISAVKNNEVDIIVVTEMRRLYRSLDELLELIKLAETTRLRGIWTTDDIGYNLSTPEGIHAAVAAVNNAKLEVAVMSKRHKRKQKARAELGKHHGGVRPYCYEPPKRDDNGNLINRATLYTALVPEEVEVFKNCVRRLIAGERAIWIVRSLNERGVKSAAGGKWTVGNFQRLMLKKRYVIFDDNDPEQRGTLVYNDKEFQAEWKGLITKAEHALMAAQFKSKARPWGANQGSGRAYLLTGMIFCGRCGGNMHGGGRVNRQKRFERRYICKRFGSHGVSTGQCGRMYRITAPVDALVIESVFERFNSPEVMRALAEPNNAKEELDELVTKLAHARRHRQNLVLEYGRGEHKKADYHLMLTAADGSIEHVERHLAKLQGSLSSGLLPKEGALSELWDDMTLDWQRSILSLVVEKVIIHPCHPVRRRWREWKFEPDSVEIVWRY
jgi:site-specific DNA recombinase